MTDFRNIAYLNKGSAEQQRIYRLLSSTAILETLAAYDPILIGTYPLDIQTDASDIDIACQFSDIDYFEIVLTRLFAHLDAFTINRSVTYNEPAIVANFNIDNQPFEIFGQAIPVNKQMGYLHMLAEYRILSENDNNFKQAVINLKKQGIKTEPAFAQLLGLAGDPYVALLDFIDTP